MRPAPSRPRPAPSPALDKLRSGCGHAKSGDSSASHRWCRFGHRRTPWRPRCRHGEDRPMGAGKPGLQRLKNDRRFPPLGVKAVESDQRATQKATVAHKGGRVTSPPPTLFSQRAQPSPLWSNASPLRRAIEGSVMGEGEGSGGGDGGAGGALSPVGGSKGPEPLASPNVLHWVGWFPGTTRCDTGPAVPASHGVTDEGRGTGKTQPRFAVSQRTRKMLAIARCKEPNRLINCSP